MPDATGAYQPAPPQSPAERFGLLFAAAFYLATHLTTAAPLTARGGAWYFADGVWMALFVAAVAGYGHVSTSVL